MSGISKYFVSATVSGAGESYLVKLDRIVPTQLCVHRIEGGQTERYQRGTLRMVGNARRQLVQMLRYHP